MLKTYFIDENENVKEKVKEMGIDEAGRGPLIGRVYAAAVVIGDLEKDMPLITDSKKMTRLQRQKAEKWIKENVEAYAVSFAEPGEIDEINILEATRLAMQRCIDRINDEKDNIRCLVIDGWRWEKKFDNTKYDVHSVVKGDSTYLSIAMASILAKEEHDRYIIELCNTYPMLNDRYDLLNNMGYGTKKHLDGIKMYGISEFHRKSFKPCRD